MSLQVVPHENDHGMAANLTPAPEAGDLADMTLPGPEGHATGHAAARIVLADDDRAQAAGFDAYLIKPVSLTRLAHTLAGFAGTTVHGPVI